MFFKVRGCFCLFGVVVCGRFWFGGGCFVCLVDYFLWFVVVGFFPTQWSVGLTSGMLSFFVWPGEDGF